MTFYRVCWQTLKSIWQSSGLSSHSYLVTNLLAASADHVDIKNLNKNVEDCRRKLLKCPSRRLYSRRQLLDVLSYALYDRFQQLGGIENQSPITAKA